MSHIGDLQSATSLSDLATLLAIKPGMLSNELYRKSKSSRYTNFQIPKRYGGNREILAPRKSLKLIQYRLAQYLDKCTAEINEARGHVESADSPGIAHGFKKGHSIITNARPHVRRRWVFNIDLENFFGTINFGRVRGFLISNRSFSVNPAVATVIAQIACHDNFLPQGSPCSPIISNLIGHPMDIIMVQLAKATDCVYTRYADDLTFSSNKPKFSARVAYQLDPLLHEWQAGDGLKRAVKRAGFKINDQKTRMQYSDSQQVVTGLTVNQKPNVTATYRATVRAMAHRLFRTGGFDFVGQKDDGWGGKTTDIKVGRISQLIGMLAHIDYVDCENRRVNEANNFPAISTAGRIALFRRVLYFRNFFATTEPLIVCEGKTDNVYLRCALKSLASSYPRLAHIGPPPKLGVRLFKYGKRRTEEITEIKGGTGGLCKLIKHYHDETISRFKAAPSRWPVIVLIDNDKGKDAVFGAIAGVTGKHKPNGTEPFIHVVANLYVVATPLTATGDDTMIEDFFDSATLSAKLDGKTFDPSKDADNAKNYSKAAFARDVVAKQSLTINFSAFSGIFDRFIKVLDDYDLRASGTVVKSTPTAKSASGAKPAPAAKLAPTAKSTAAAKPAAAAKPPPATKPKKAVKP